MSGKKYCRLCKKKETREQCGYGPKLFDKYSVDDATEKETAEAAAESGITEGNKSGDSSLHDWFSKSKSSDGKKGWVQLGGKYAGKPCAKQPGQTTKPKCITSVGNFQHTDHYFFGHNNREFVLVCLVKSGSYANTVLPSDSV